MRVRLSRKAWHYRLQEFVWGSASQYSICPYFWLTVFAILFLPIALIGRAAKSKMYPDMTLPDSEWRELHGYYSHKKTNSEVGIEVGFATFIGGLLLFLAGSGLFLLFTLITSSASGAIGVGIALAVILAFVGLYKSSELWVPFVWSIKDSVCPVITWDDPVDESIVPEEDEITEQDVSLVTSSEEE